MPAAALPLLEPSNRMVEPTEVRHPREPAGTLHGESGGGAVATIDRLYFRQSAILRLLSAVP